MSTTKVKIEVSSDIGSGVGKRSYFEVVTGTLFAEGTQSIGVAVAEPLDLNSIPWGGLLYLQNKDSTNVVQVYVDTNLVASLGPNQSTFIPTNSGIGGNGIELQALAADCLVEFLYIGL